ncbi:MAG: universal stress protein [Mycobacterium sp.]|nr:universal stress protein [Mycobacterium sp.]
MVAIRQILLPTDFSVLADHAARYARSLAETYQASLHVLHVVSAVLVPVPGPEVGTVAMAVPSDASVAEAQETLERFVQNHLSGLAVPVVTKVLEGAPDLQISRYAADAAIDLIVIGTHARGLVRRIFLGSVSKAVVEHATCPVLMVPLLAAEADSPVPDQRTTSHDAPKPL